MTSSTSPDAEVGGLVALKNSEGEVVSPKLADSAHRVA